MSVWLKEHGMTQTSKAFVKQSLNSRSPLLCLALPQSWRLFSSKKVGVGGVVHADAAADAELCIFPPAWFL